MEAKENLQRMLANIPLTDEQQAAVEDGQAALAHLLERLIDVPTPDGATPPRDRCPRDRQPAADYRGQPGRTVHEFHIMVPVRLFFDVLMEGFGRRSRRALVIYARQ